MDRVSSEKVSDLEIFNILLQPIQMLGSWIVSNLFVLHVFLHFSTSNLYLEIQEHLAH